MTLAVLLFGSIRLSRNASRLLYGLLRRRCMAFVFRPPVFLHRQSNKELFPSQISRRQAVRLWLGGFGGLNVNDTVSCCQKKTARS